MRSYVVILLTVACLTAVQSVAAHGGGTPRLVNASVGPYVLSVWGRPDRPPVGESAHFSVALAEAAVGVDGRALPGAPVLDAVIVLTLTPPDGGAPLAVDVMPATSGGELYYEGDVRLDKAGLWSAVVEVTGPAGAGQTSFSVTVVTATADGWLFAGAAATVVLVAGLLIARGKRVGPAPSRRVARQTVRRS